MESENFIEEESRAVVEIEPQKRKQPSVHYRVYFYRFIALIAFDLIISIDAIVDTYIDPMISTIGILYNINLENWMLMSVCLTLLGIPATLLVIPLIEKAGVHISLIIGVCGLMGSIWMRTAINHSIYYILGNLVIYDIFHMFYILAITKVSVRWFPPSQRVMATFATNIVADISMFVGNYIPTWYVHLHSDEDPANWDKDKLKKDIYDGLFMEAILGSVMCGIALMLYRERPKSPPSPADDKISSHQKSEVVRGMIQLFKNKNFMILIIGHTCYMTMGIIETVNQSMLYTPFDIDPLKATSYTNMAGVIAGTVSSIAVGILLNKYKKFKVTICSCMFLVSLSCILSTFLPFTGNLTWVVMGAGLSAFVSNPERSTLFEFACELGYPVGESAILGVIMALQAPLAVIIQISMRNVVNHPSTHKSVIFGLASAAVFMAYGVATIFIKEDLRRDRRDTSIMEGYTDSFAFGGDQYTHREGGEFEGFQLTPVQPLLLLQGEGEGEGEGE